MLQGGGVQAWPLEDTQIKGGKGPKSEKRFFFTWGNLKSGR